MSTALNTRFRSFFRSSFSWAMFLCLVLFELSGLVASAQEVWTKLGDDLEILRLPSNSSLLSAETTLIRSSLVRYRIGVIRASDFGRKNMNVKTLAKMSRAALTINANFFDEAGKPLGLIMSRGLVQQGIHRGGSTLTGIFFAGRDGVGITNRNTFKEVEALEAIQAGPRLLASGHPVKIMNAASFSKRSGACVDRLRRLIIYVTSSGLVGVSIDEIQKILMNPPVSCIDALNFDGGGSSQMYLGAGILGGSREHEEIMIQGNDDVPVALGLFVRE